MNFTDNNNTNFIFDANCNNGELYVLVYSTQVNYFNFIKLLIIIKYKYIILYPKK